MGSSRGSSACQHIGLALPQPTMVLTHGRELGGVILNMQGDLLELVFVGSGMVRAEKELATVAQRDAHIACAPQRSQRSAVVRAWCSIIVVLMTTSSI